MDKTTIEQALIKAGVKNLKEYGYPKVTADNILTDVIYAAFFQSMLKENKGNSAAIDEVIEALLERMQG